MSKFRTFKQHIFEDSGSTYVLNIDPYTEQESAEFSISQLIAWSLYQSRNGMKIFVSARVIGDSSS